MKLLDAIAIVESNNSDTALRFERTLFASKPQWVTNQVGKICGVNKCSYDTGLMIACTSWGVWQLLGANLYAQGFDAPILDLLSVGDEIFARKFILQTGFNPDSELSDYSEQQLINFSAKYNGPGNPVAYANDLRRAAVT